MTDDVTRTVDLMEAIEQNSMHLYPIEPSAQFPCFRESSTLTQKSGYLFLRRWAHDVTKSILCVLTTQKYMCTFFLFLFRFLSVHLGSQIIQANVPKFV